MTLFSNVLQSLATQQQLQHQSPLLADRARARGRRVFLLVLLVLILSVGDLMTTLMFLQSIGMEEANPVAAFVMQSGSPINLIIFKMGSVLTSLSVILLIRHRWQGELAAWIAASILCALTLLWYQYTLHFGSFDNSFTMLQAQNSDSWLAWMK